MNKENLEVKLRKIEYSEIVLRKSLYWVSDSLTWSLSDVEDFWVISFSGNNVDSGIKKFHIILNDFILRERHDFLTLDIRRGVIKSALLGVWGKLDGS